MRTRGKDNGRSGEGGQVSCSMQQEEPDPGETLTNDSFLSKRGEHK